MSQEPNVPPQKGKPEGDEQPRTTPAPAQGNPPAADEDEHAGGAEEDDADADNRGQRTPGERADGAVLEAEADELEELQTV